MYHCSMNEFNHINTMPVADVVKALGNRFREYRIAVQMTQAEVSKKSGVKFTHHTALRAWHHLHHHGQLHSLAQGHKLLSRLGRHLARATPIALRHGEGRNEETKTCAPCKIT